MILLIFALGILFMLLILAVGVWQQSFAFLYLGFFIMLLLGMFVMSEGIAIDNGMQESPIGSHNFITTYTIHTAADDPVVNILGNTLFYLPIGMILLTTLVAIYRR